MCGLDGQSEATAAGVCPTILPGGGAEKSLNTGRKTRFCLNPEPFNNTRRAQSLIFKLLHTSPFNLSVAVGRGVLTCTAISLSSLTAYWRGNVLCYMNVQREEEEKTKL